MAIKIGTSDLQAAYVGDKAVTGIYVGATKVWPLDVWAGAVIATSILSGNAVLAREIAGGVVSASSLAADASRLRYVEGLLAAQSALTAAPLRIRSIAGASAAQSALSAAASILTQKFVSGSSVAVSDLSAAASRDRGVAAGIAAMASLTAPGSRLRAVAGVISVVSSAGPVAALRNRSVTGSLAAASTLAADATVEAGGITATWIAGDYSTNDLSTYNFGDFTAPSDGLLVVGSLSRQTATRTLTGLSIGGTNGTIHNTASGVQISAFASREVTAGNHNVTVSFNAPQRNCAVGVWLLTGYSSTTPTDTDDYDSIYPGISSVSNTIDVPANGITLFCAGQHTGSGVDGVSWSSATSRYNSDDMGFADKTSATLISGHTETATFAGDAGRSGMASVSFA